MVLERGRDFDQVIFAMPHSTLPFYGGALYEAHEPWKALVKAMKARQPDLVVGGTFLDDSMALVRAELATAPNPVVLQFLAWLVAYVRRPSRVWWERTAEGWRQIE